MILTDGLAGPIATGGTAGPATQIVGWDFGGAHLKVVVLDSHGQVLNAIQRPCRLWLGVHEFDQVLAEILRDLALDSGATVHALTMTGELADCFSSRIEGVDSLVTTISSKLAPAQIRFFAGRRGFVGAAELAQDRVCKAAIASANWLASARFCAQRVTQGLLVDIGSTTTDIITLDSGAVVARGTDDRTRLAADELVYTGIVRTPLAALASRAPFAGEWHNLVAEHFATTADVYRLTGELPEKADQMPAADNRGKTVEDSARRLARMIGDDLGSIPSADWRRLAAWFAECQLRTIHSASARVLSRGVLPDDAPLIGAGVGSFIVRKLADRLQRRYVDFASLIPSPATAGITDDWIGACAPAYSVAWLALAEEPTLR